MTTGKRKRARRSDGRSLLRKRVKSIVKVKPQLPPVTGPFTRVRFFALQTSDPQVGSVRIVGDLVLRDGRIIAEPPDSIALTNILAEPLGVYQEDGPLKLIDHKAEPEAFLEGCLTTYGHGTYFWAEPVKD